MLAIREQEKQWYKEWREVSKEVISHHQKEINYAVLLYGSLTIISSNKLQI